jgi:hypothetical protein
MVPWGVGVEPVKETVTIPQGGRESWDIDTRGYSVRYSVKVVSGGTVDVTAAKFAYQDGEMGYFYISGHKHLNVRSVEGTVSSFEDLGSFDLFVENDSGPDAVMANVEIEHVPTMPIWLIAIIGILTFIISIIAGTRREAEEAEADESIERDMAAVQAPTAHDRHGRPVDSFCLDCGAQQVIDESSGYPCCPRCGRYG